FQEVNLELQVAPGFKEIDAPAGIDAQAVLRFDLPVAMGGAVGDGAKLRVPVLEREVVMAAGSELEARDFTRDPDVGELAGNHGTDRRCDFRDAENAPPRDKVEIEAKLVH